MQAIVFGATGVVGGHILRTLIGSGQKPYAISRQVQEEDGHSLWMKMDLSAADVATLSMPAVHYLFSTVHPKLTARMIPRIANDAFERAVIVTSTSISTKLNSEIESERANLLQLAEGENEFISACEKHNIMWTVLRPTIVYAEGQDVNITRIAQFIRRFGFFPISGKGNGLRQPVHAADLARGAISAARSQVAANRVYIVPGNEAITYREMVGRVFDGMGRRRRVVTIPHSLWKAAFICASPFLPGANFAMGARMSKDMVFDGTDAARDFGWRPREFRPKFGRRIG